ncbi:MAG: DUF4861 domain-containing protein [Rikenellaceae bacterium]|nr:DUF4861 domain-containing protein [Rikenellaceae bacterium]
MKRLLILSLLLAGLTSTLLAQTVVTPKDGVATVTVKNPNNYAVEDAIVVLKIDHPSYRSAEVKAGGKVIPSQVDVFDNGTSRELAFVIDLKAGQSRKVKIAFSESAQDPNTYRSRTHAQMFLKENGQNVPKEVIAAPEDNMYNKLHHHGPAIESELTAYRVYFDKKQSVDLYGKVVKRIELPVTMWYPTDQQLADKYGDDVLFIGQSLGLGPLKGWDGEKAIHIEPMTGREAKVLATGPVRAIMEMNVYGWEYQGQKIDMSTRYTIYAGHRDVCVQNKISGSNVSGLEFATGIQKLRRGDIMHTDDRGMYADWGTDYPVNDTVKYPMQTIGLGISVPENYLVRQTQDPLNYICVVKPDAGGQINYRITFAAEKEEFGYKTPEAFFRYIDMWKDEKPMEVTVKK